MTKQKKTLKKHATRLAHKKLAHNFPRISTRNMLWLIFGLIIAATAAYVTYRLSSFHIDRSAITVRDQLQERRKIEALETQSRDLWERYISARDFRGKAGGEEIQLLAEALRLREEYVKLNSARGDSALLIEAMRKEWQMHQANDYEKRSKKAEAAGNEALQQKDYATAAKAFAEAFELENKISSEYRLAQKENSGRRAHLGTRLRFARGFPISQESRALEKEGDAAMQEKKWDLAAKKFMVAREKEEILSANYAGLFNIEFSRPAKLLAKHDTARASATHEQIQQIVADAMHLANTGRSAEAEARWDVVMGQYKKLERECPLSIFVQKEAIKELWEKREKNLSARVLAMFRRDVDALDATLRNGSSGDVTEVARRLLQESTRIQSKYTHIPTVDQETHSKLQCLSVCGHAAPLARRLLQKSLRPLPGDPALQLMNIEVSQEFYSAVTGNDNFSAARGKDLPADSVSYEDALRFCQNLGWLTAGNVRLPTRKEFCAAVGDTSTFQPTQAWSYENSGNSTHPVGTSQPNSLGFHDLLGNVSEWVSGDEARDSALELGGNYQTSRHTLASVPSISTPKRDRSRLRGFRVLVDSGGKP